MNTDRRGFLAGLLALPVILRVGARPEVGAQEPCVGSPAPEHLLAPTFSRFDGTPGTTFQGVPIYWDDFALDSAYDRFRYPLLTSLR